MMKKMRFKVNIEDEKSERRMMKLIAGIKGVESVAVDMNEKKITVIGDADPVCVVCALRKIAFCELISVGPAREETKVGSKRDTENRGSNQVRSKRDTENRGSNHYLGVQRPEAVGGFGGMNRAIEDNEGREKRIMEAVAGFGDFTIIEVDIKKGMVTVVGKSVPVSVALKVREMGYRAKLLSLGPATEEEDTDEKHNDDPHPYPTHPPDPYVYPTRLPDPYDPYVYSIVEDATRCTSRCTIA